MSSTFRLEDLQAPAKLKAVPLDIQRTECPVIRRQGDPAALKKAYTSLKRILKTMPDAKQDPAVSLRQTRNRRGLV